MPTRRAASKQELESLRALLSLQFDEDVAAAIVSLPLEVELRRGKIRYVYYNGDRLMTLRPRDFSFTISLTAGEIIRRAAPQPKYRVIVKGPIRGDVHGYEVLSSDAQIRPGDEVLVVDAAADKLLAVGKARVPGFMMRSLGSQSVVRVREVAKQ